MALTGCRTSILPPLTIPRNLRREYGTISILRGNGRSAGSNQLPCYYPHHRYHPHHRWCQLVFLLPLVPVGCIEKDHFWANVPSEVSQLGEPCLSSNMLQYSMHEDRLESALEYMCGLKRNNWVGLGAGWDRVGKVDGQLHGQLLTSKASSALSCTIFCGNCREKDVALRNPPVSME